MANQGVQGSMWDTANRQVRVPHLLLLDRVHFPFDESTTKHPVATALEFPSVMLNQNEAESWRVTFGTVQPREGNPQISPLFTTVKTTSDRIVARTSTRRVGSSSLNNGSDKGRTGTSRITRIVLLKNVGRKE